MKLGARPHEIVERRWDGRVKLPSVIRMEERARRLRITQGKACDREQDYTDGCPLLYVRPAALPEVNRTHEVPAPNFLKRSCQEQRSKKRYAQNSRSIGAAGYLCGVG